MTEQQKTAAILHEIHQQVATCPACRAARQQRRQSGAALRARLARCSAAGDTDNSCPACIAADDQHAAACLEEILALAGHPHNPTPTHDHTESHRHENRRRRAR